MTTLEKVRAVILKLKKKNITEADLKPEAGMVEDLKLDSIDMAELLVLTEEAFGLKISDDEVKKMTKNVVINPILKTFVFMFIH